MLFFVVVITKLYQKKRRKWRRRNTLSAEAYKLKRRRPVIQAKIYFLQNIWALSAQIILGNLPISFPKRDESPPPPFCRGCVQVVCVLQPRTPCFPATIPTALWQEGGYFCPHFVEELTGPGAPGAPAEGAERGPECVGVDRPCREEQRAGRQSPSPAAGPRSQAAPLKHEVQARERLAERELPEPGP